MRAHRAYSRYNYRYIFLSNPAPIYNQLFIASCFVELPLSSQISYSVGLHYRNIHLGESLRTPRQNRVYLLDGVLESVRHIH
ncbi:hypothetical protein CY34DRAFT_252914 [Suillus luteus UH-Slu-Lm8-n1]|uniref:Uncharacterized protein n=1 Tax=Suillus luteus UH-Slu-Lm8-n1 TaxID=930992 RepID=A0A0C9ZSF3_9AGAM|nr:hypothetical protein CY34DRAFT_252914 [Suillus luteus UH-Slu-Lm8-n1]